MEVGMAREYVVLTAMGPDRPGIVDTLSGFLLDAGANIEDSRMAVLGEAFAIILLASGDAGLEPTLRPGLAATEEKTGLAIVLAPSKPSARTEPSIPCEVTAVALDHPGIVHTISHEVAKCGANIESLETRSAPAPVSGSPMFTLTMLCCLPRELRFQDFRDRIEAAGVEIGVDVTARMLGT
jgi:glycine cleavage system transcriptional repressor